MGNGDSNTGTETDRSGSGVLLELPEDLRGAFKEPFGPLFTDPEELLATVSGPVVAVGDVVTYHLLEAGRMPEIALVDGYTERSPVERAIEARIERGEPDRQAKVTNPAGTLSADLLDALAAGLSDVSEAIETDNNEAIDRLVITVDGEEDLATLPAIVGAPNGVVVVYGQPGEGMVRVTVNGETRERARELLVRMNGDHEAVWDRIG